MKLFKLGKQTDVAVDDRLLMIGRKNLFHTRVLINGAYWMPILEKGVAKFFANYANIDGGLEGAAFRFLTNMPVINFKPSQMRNDELYSILSEADKKGWSMSAACNTAP